MYIFPHASFSTHALLTCVCVEMGYFVTCTCTFYVCFFGVRYMGLYDSVEGNGFFFFVTNFHLLAAVMQLLPLCSVYSSLKLKHLHCYSFC